MKKSFIVPFCFAAWLQWSMTIAVAQPSVYSGVYADGEGGLTTSSDWQAVTNFVSNAQKGVSIVNNFDSWTDTASSTNGTQTFPTTEMNNIRSSNSIPLFTWQPQNGTEGVTQSFTLASIIAGNYDSYITTWATSAKAWGHPFFLRFAHEMNGNWYPWCAGVNGNTAAQYVQMWQHVHNIFTSVGATNVTWVWCVNTLYSGSTAIDTLYPGDNYVDWIALDGYNRLANPWQDFSAIVATTVTQLTNVAPGKPIMVAETGCNQTNNPTETKAQWFLAALTNYLPSVPRIKAWVYFNSTNATDGNDWRITSPANAVTGYQEGIGLPYYDTDEYGAISNSPIQPLLNDDTTTDTMPPFVSIVSPVTDQVTNGTVVNVLAPASDKYGVSNVVFAVNGVGQQTNSSPPYQFSWIVPFNGVMTYTITATAYDNGGNSAVSTIQVVSQGTGATNIFQTVTEGTGTNWNAASWGGPPAAVPTSANNYETPGGLIVRTPASDGPVAAFAGNSLQIDSGGILDLKNGGETNGNAATVNLLLNGGTMNFHGGFAPDGPAVAGTIQVSANSVITTDQTGANAADILVESPISGSGNLTVNMNSTTNSVILTGNNSGYSGNWTNASTSGNIKILSGTTNALGSGGVILVNPNASLIINSTNNLVVNNLISGAGPVLMQNTGPVILTANNTFSGSLTINAGTIVLTGSGAQGSTLLSSNSVLCIANSAALPSGSALTIAPNNAQTGELELSNSVTVATGNPISVAERTGPTVAIESVSGSNVISDQISIFSGGTSPIGIQADTGSTLVLNGGVISGVAGSPGVMFQGAGNGSVSGGINNGPATTVSVYITGSGTWTLNNTNTYTGPTQISNAVLQLGADASIGGTPMIQLSSGAVLNVAAVSGGFAVGSSQTLAGVGSVSGNVTVNGTVSPGPLGTLNFANSLVLSGTAVMELNRTNAQNADLISAATLALGGTLTVTNIGGALQAGDSFQLFSGAISGAFSATSLPALSPTNLFWDTSRLNSQGILALALEPAASPTILPPSWNGTNLTLQVNSQTGYNYVLEVTPQLAPANWTAIQTNGGGGLLTFTIPINADTQQFFRIGVQ
jgi:autotransporter-associated beta strand protein